MVYLDAAGVQQVVTVATNGTTGVSLGDGLSYVQWAEVASVGTNTTSLGNLTISTVVGAPTTAQTVEYIASGQNRSRSGRYKVPVGYKAYLHTWDCAAIGNTQDLVLRATVFSDDRAASSVFHTQDDIFLPGNTSGTGLLLHYMSCPPGTEIKVSSIPGAAAVGNRADVTFHLLLVAL